jgi:hypothetical protein
MFNMRDRISALMLCLLLAYTLTLAAQTARSQAKPKAPATVPSPGFTVNLTYSAQALKTLRDKKETVIVSVEINGYPKVGSPKKYFDMEGGLEFANRTLEVQPGQPVVFDKFDLNSSLLSFVDADGPQVQINVYSGRKSSEWNLLDCGAPSGPIKDFSGKTITVACKMIGEK